MNAPATPAKPSATSPRGKRSDETERAVPPSPVSGPPWGRRKVGVAADEPVGDNVVVTPGEPAASVVGVVDAALVVVVVPPTLVVVVVVVALVVVVVVEVARRQVGTVIVLSSIVTAPPSASARPLMVAPVSSVIEAVARIVPAKLVVVPSVAELPTCQKTLHACAPFSRVTELDDAVVRVDPASKMKTESGLPAPFRVTAPVKPMDDVLR
jgi:hypothetical protein